MLTRVQCDILLEMGQQGITLLVLLDLSAAFDTIDYAILEQMFQQKFRVTGNAANWFVSYLTDRRQRIIIDNVLSKPMDLKCGVPQGSCAGPTLYSVYASTVQHVITEGTQIHGYADDHALGCVSGIFWR